LILNPNPLARQLRAPPRHRPHLPLLGIRDKAQRQPAA
jgi:hypothetical protein